MERSTFIRQSFVAGLALSFRPDLMLTLPADAGFLRIVPAVDSLQLNYFSIDSLGKNDLSTNFILPLPVEQKVQSITKENETSYWVSGVEKSDSPNWRFKVSPTSFSLQSTANSGKAEPFVLCFEQHVNHCTLLGIMKGEDQRISLPAILHFPDRGSLRVTSNHPEASVICSSQRFIEHPFVKLEFPASSNSSSAVDYHFEVVTIHPRIRGIENDAHYDAFRKNFISIFQLNPKLKILSNNSSSDACAFTLFKYATVAAFVPPLAPGLSALDLVRMTLDRYLSGQKGYGQLGYDYDKTWDIPESPTHCNSLDSYPSLIISACIYATAKIDKQWFHLHYKQIKAWALKMLAADSDNDGLLEFCLSGNSGSWKGDKTQRPANWWDTIGFAHKDAYSNALAYKALTSLAKATQLFRMHKETAFYQQKAKRLMDHYTKTFYNPATGIIAGWKSADGALHDYYFTFVNGVAISYGLIEDPLANKIMDALLLKMKEVGFTNFELGMPGNLIPVKRADYTDLLREVGGGQREDNLDGFQIYENGGATACFTYFTIHALLRLGRMSDADMILFPLLKSMSEGNFQGRCENGRSKDWKTWTGECWGYEGFLVDNYMFLLAVLERNLGHHF